MVSILVEEPWFPWLFSLFYWFSINYLYTCCYMVVHVVFWFRAERTSKLLALFHLFATFKKNLLIYEKFFLYKETLTPKIVFFILHLEAILVSYWVTCTGKIENSTVVLYKILDITCTGQVYWIERTGRLCTGVMSWTRTVDSDGPFFAWKIFFNL